MRPILFYVGNVPIFSYGLFIFLGIVALFTTALRAGRKANYSWEQLIPVSLGILVGGMVGAKLSHALVEPADWVEILDFFGLFRPQTPGNIVGLMFGGFVGGTAIRLSLEIPAMGHIYAIPMALASVIWRIGCTMAGCCHGVETDLPWAVFLENARRHPTMVYEGIFNLILLFVVWKIKPRFDEGDTLIFIYYICYSFFRFFIEFIRVYPPIAFGLTGIQFICCGIFIWSIVRLYREQSQPNLPALEGA
ncbi:MAG: prolipoprotein diacylglyceryl transferase family protein [Chloroflexota bacterium]